MVEGRLERTFRYRRVVKPSKDRVFRLGGDGCRAHRFWYYVIQSCVLA